MEDHLKLRQQSLKKILKKVYLLSNLASVTRMLMFGRRIEKEMREEKRTAVGIYRSIKGTVCPAAIRIIPKNPRN